MVTKQSGNSEMKQVRTQWARARRSWLHTEASVEALMQANAGLLESLSKAGASAAKRAAKELNLALRKLEHGRAKAQAQFAKLVKHHEPAHRGSARVTAR